MKLNKIEILKSHEDVLQHTRKISQSEKDA
jgi:hypothetical protein